MAIVRMQDIQDASTKQQIILNSFTTPDGKIKNNKRIQDVFPKDIWKNKRCFVIGGGSSLKNFNFNKLTGELVITTNRGLEFYPKSAINLCTDARVWGWYEDKSFGDEAKEKFYSYKGHKVWLNVQAFPFPEDIYTINPIFPTDFNFSDYYRGLSVYGNSGVNAIMLAACLGANPIYLLGFDLYGVNGKTANYHSGYPEGGNKEDLYSRFLEDFKDASLKLKTHTKVINLNPKSKLPYFEFGTFNKITKVTRPIIVSFYTPEYKPYAEKMEQSAIKFGFDTDIIAVDKKGDWLKTVYSRANFVKSMLLKHKRSIVWIDSDAQILQYPDLFDNLEVDFAAHFLDTKTLYGGGYPKDVDLLGGTMFFNYNEKTLKLVDDWISNNETMPKQQLSQWVLHETIKKFDGKILNLPPTYCQIFDSMAGLGEPVIEHYVKSRSFRNV